jgi:hypothetical protein
MRRKCDGCGKEFTAEEEISSHWGHEPDCPNFDESYLETHMLECDCDLWYHPQCCPNCKQRDMQEETKQLTRVISFVKSLGGLYADIAEDAKMELNKLIDANKELFENHRDVKDDLDDFR